MIDGENENPVTITVTGFFVDIFMDNTPYMLIFTQLFIIGSFRCFLP